VKYELGFHIPEDDILHSDRRENLRCYKKEHYEVPHTQQVESSPHTISGKAKRSPVVYIRIFGVVIAFQR
jgi:hypothetical protein